MTNPVTTGVGGRCAQESRKGQGAREAPDSVGTPRLWHASTVPQGRVPSKQVVRRGAKEERVSYSNSSSWGLLILVWRGVPGVTNPVTTGVGGRCAPESRKGQGAREAA